MIFNKIFHCSGEPVYGHTAEYKEFEEKSKGRTNEEAQKLSVQMMAMFSEFGSMRKMPPESEKVHSQVKKLQHFITEHFYTCSDEVLYGLGSMYAGGGKFTENINKAGGDGTAEFVFKAIQKYCNK